MKRGKTGIIVVIGCILVLLSAVPSLKAETAAEFYKDKVVTLVVAGAAGAGADVKTRLLTPFWSEELGATVAVKNMPAAGGMEAFNWMYTQAKPDGLTFAMLSWTSLLVGSLDPAAKYDPTKFELIGVLDPMNYVLNVKKNGITSVKDFKEKKDLKLAGLIPTAGPTVTAALVLELLNPNGKLITGYNMREATLATARGETDGFCCSIMGAIQNEKQGYTIPLLQVGKQKMRGFDVPLVADVVESSPLLEAYCIATPGDVYWLPPGVPKDRVDFMRKALEEMFVEGSPAIKTLMERYNFHSGYKSYKELDDILSKWASGGREDYKKVLDLVSKYRR